MLDPYVRSWLRHDGSGRFSALVKVPDAYGVFKWVVDYRRLGYSYIELTGGWVGLGAVGGRLFGRLFGSVSVLRSWRRRRIGVEALPCVFPMLRMAVAES